MNNRDKMIDKLSSIYSALGKISYLTTALVIVASIFNVLTFSLYLADAISLASNLIIASICLNGAVLVLYTYTALLKHKANKLQHEIAHEMFKKCLQDKDDEM